MAQYTLKLSFDLRQVTQSLAYEFIQQNNVNYALEAEGPLAGTFNFQIGDEIFVEVAVTSAQKSEVPKSVLEGFTVTNCTFVSIPARMTEELSLFDPRSACSTIDEPSNWTPLETKTLPKNNIQFSKRSLKPLVIGTKSGQWKISGYLSVELSPEGGPAFSQLYFFDPEGSTGNGGDF